MQDARTRVLRTAQTRVSRLTKRSGFPGPGFFQNPGFNPYLKRMPLLDIWHFDAYVVANFVTVGIVSQN